MPLDFGNNPFKSEERQRGIEEGFGIAESYLMRISKEFHKQMKKGLLQRMATVTTISTHKCNCEFCGLDEK